MNTTLFGSNIVRKLQETGKMKAQNPHYYEPSKKAENQQGS